MRFFWRHRVYPLLVAIDQVLKVLMFGGNPDITVSDYVGRVYPDTWIEKCINTLFWWDKNHTQMSFEKEETIWRDK